MIKVTQLERSNFKEKGYLIKKKLFSEQEVQKIKDEMEMIWISKVFHKEILQEEDNHIESLFPRLGNIHRESQFLFNLMLDSRTMGVVEQLIDERALAIQTVGYLKAPGGKGIQVHQDNYEIGADPGTTYAAWISLDEGNEKNGGMFVVPGTQRLEVIVPKNRESTDFLFDLHIEIPDGYQAIPINTMPGDVVFFGGNLLHGSFRNQTNDSFRRSFVTHYVGSSVEKLTMYHNKLINHNGDAERRRINVRSKFMEVQRHLLKSDPS
ncbi:phytanoyl-CoA dioxygenase family protein [Cytobacillus oceanisediminis]|uniref:phytanoyl-CoA dioxygenase family protein n=1 Tax=Cytobacillus oceanisediminis TaxID=665099 RepID=UPI001C221ECA|nr:phytanoyl-CoA dioxygenase family protein [Cytobacillus oceanisediminis]MBU8772067.1 phytanoyl-CoA dioxygenase family protein [Cytobacillus oceanisediminis]